MRNSAGSTGTAKRIELFDGMVASARNISSRLAGYHRHRRSHDHESQELEPIAPDRERHERHEAYEIGRNKVRSPIVTRSPP
jgi:hypothetical protein